MNIKNFPFPQTREEKYETEHFRAWQEGEYADDHCSLCIGWTEQNAIDEKRYQEMRAKERGEI